MDEETEFLTDWCKLGIVVNHVNGIVLIGDAVVMGCAVVEKHLCLDLP